MTSPRLRHSALALIVTLILLPGCSGSPGSLTALTSTNASPLLQADDKGVFALSPVMSTVAAGLVRIDIASPDLLPEEILIQDARFVMLSIPVRSGYRSYVADPASAPLPLRSIQELGIPGVTSATIEVVYLQQEIEGSSLIYQGDATQVTFEDYILVRAIGDLPPLLRTAENIATRANELFPSGAFSAGALSPVPDELNTEFAAGGSVPPPDLTDALVVYAATFLPPNLRTADNLAAVVNALDPSANLSGADIVAIPGGSLPGGIPLEPAVSGRPAGSFQISVQDETLATPQFTIENAAFIQLPVDPFPGFTTFAAEPSSSLLSLDFAQLQIDGVDAADCVVVHFPGQDPSSGASQIARSEGCGESRPLGSVRFAQFNASLNRNALGQLITDLSSPNQPQAQNIAEIIQRVNPDVLLVNEFDFDEAGQAAELFRDNYLAISQADGVNGVNYPYYFIAPSNTGIASGFDLNNNGQVVTTPGASGYGDDALGFGNYPGQFAMIVYSKFPIDTANARTFQKFLWKDMPGALLPDDPGTSEPADFYSPAELDIFRLSSKSHWDLPININGTIIHALVSHPTPPVFDGPEDRNGRRNFDEIRFWLDYITPGSGDYIYDDQGQTGGLTPGANFVIMGDQNSDPNDGDSVPGAANQILDSPLTNTSVTPSSLGGPDAAARQVGINANHLSDPAFDTADFADTAPGNLRADYVLPSSDLQILEAKVFWPEDEDPLFNIVGDFNPALDPNVFPARSASSDHRLVWVDLAP